MFDLPKPVSGGILTDRQRGMRYPMALRKANPAR
jgi:hypothetical protein